MLTAYTSYSLSQHIEPVQNQILTALTGNWLSQRQAAAFRYLPDGTD